MKVDLEDVAQQLHRPEVPATVRDTIISDLKEIVEAEKKEAEKNRQEKQKWEHVIVGTDPAFNPDTPLFLMKIPESDNFHDLKGRIIEAVRSFNTGQHEKKRGKKNFINKIGQAVEVLVGKKASEFEFKVAQKTPVIAVKIDNDLPVEIPRSHQEED